MILILDCKRIFSCSYTNFELQTKNSKESNQIKYYSKNISSITYFLYYYCACKDIFSTFVNSFLNTIYGI
ncbi:MAG: hypothetical protein AUJ98_11280 [Bacteroidetes bacterium CG2_30_33_31]|nr:MAG: hypothetical protein AUJ98_11280 [Bacteroidetes bacterium CG2_30_33_31]